MREEWDKRDMRTASGKGMESWVGMENNEGGMG